jgi:hypothetical protein
MFTTELALALCAPSAIGIDAAPPIDAVEGGSTAEEGGMFIVSKE